MKYCMFCGTGEPAPRPETTTLTLARDGVTVTIAGVPSLGCAVCGEHSISGPLAERIDDAASEIIAAIQEQRAVAPAAV